MLRFDADRVRRDAERANTDDLLDRVTVYRAGLEPEAISLIEDVLRARGVTAADISRHGEERAPVVRALPDGTARPCSFCWRPAVAEGWGWHRMWGVLPLFPRYRYYCEQHRPRTRFIGSRHNESANR